MIASYKKNLFKDFSGWFTELGDLAQNTEDNSSLPRLELLLHTGVSVRGSFFGRSFTTAGFEFIG